MKKTLSILLSILMLISVFAPFSAYAREQQTSGFCGNNATFELKDGILTISGTGEITSAPWLEYIVDTTNINKVIICEGITVIGEYSFSNCTNLKEVIMPQSLIGIKRSAFYECKKLEKADLPRNLVYIGSSSFNTCTSLKKIELPKSLKTIYTAAFIRCTSIEGKLIIPKGVNIENLAFCHCESLDGIYFEDGFLESDYLNSLSVFKKCTGVKSIYIPSSMKGIPGAYFSGCKSLKDVTISEGVEHISGFDGCTSLKKITLPKSAKSISGFSDCKNLKTVKIQSKLDYIEGDSFINCPSLKSIKIPFGVDTVEEHFCGYTTVSNDEKQSLEYKPIKNFKIYGKKCKAITDYCKKHGFTFIDMYDVKNATATMKSQTYSGKAKKPAVTLKLAGVTLQKDIDFTVKYSNNIKVGTAKVTITGKGKYKGTLTKTFKINPKPTELTKLTPKSKSFKAYWKKNKSQTSGYQIQYSVYKSFKNAKKVTVKGYKTGARTVKDLKSNKKYFVRVRAYKAVDGKKYYSKWSESKSVKTE